jgi:hypothetical protein
MGVEGGGGRAEALPGLFRSYGHSQLLWVPLAHPGLPCRSSCSLEIASKSRQPVIRAEGPPAPNPLVIERFQGVVSQLFSQVSRRAIDMQPEILGRACEA